MSNSTGRSGQHRRAAARRLRLGHISTGTLPRRSLIAATRATPGTGPTYRESASVMASNRRSSSPFTARKQATDRLPAHSTWSRRWRRLAYEGRRRRCSKSEFVAALKLLDARSPAKPAQRQLCGATGYPQFMPSVVLRLRADGDGDGNADIWRSEDEAWRPSPTICATLGGSRMCHGASRCRVPGNLNRAAIRSAAKAPRCPAVYARHSQWKTDARMARQRAFCRPASRCRTMRWRP